MMGGMGMLLKSMGFNPDQVQQQIETAAKEFIAIKQQMNRIEANQIIIMQHLGIIKDDKIAS